ncbi:hypothetical protein [Clostridium sp. Marseille-Q7071]
MSNQCNDETAKIKTKQTMQDFNKWKVAIILAWFNYGVMARVIYGLRLLLDGFYW